MLKVIRLDGDLKKCDAIRMDGKLTWNARRMDEIQSQMDSSVPSSTTSTAPAIPGSSGGVAPPFPGKCPIGTLGPNLECLGPGEKLYNTGALSNKKLIKNNKNKQNSILDYFGNKCFTSFLPSMYDSTTANLRLDSDQPGLHRARVRGVPPYGVQGGVHVGDAAGDGDAAGGGRDAHAREGDTAGGEEEWDPEYTPKSRKYYFVSTLL